MTLRGPIDAAVPTLLTPIGEVEIEGKRYPVRLDGNYRRLLEALFQRTGSFDDEVFDIDAVSSDLGSRIEDAVNRLEALEAGGQEVSDLLSALEELRQRIDVIESLPSVAEPVDAERLVADAVAAASNAVEEAEFNRPGIGVLGGEDAVTRELVAAGFALLETGSGVPTVTRLRLYLDQSSNILWFDTGSEVRRLTSEEKTGTLASDTNFSSTSYVVVMGTTYTGTTAVNLATLISATINFQSPAASADTATGQWAVFISDTSVATNSAVETGNFRKIAEGASAGITFATVGSVINNGDDVDDVLGGLGYIGTQIEGTTYVYLCIKVTSGGGESINLASSGTNMISALG